MSLLGKIVRAYLVGRAGYTAAVPGGISPEVVAIGNAMPYVYYSGVSKTRTNTCGNVPVLIGERITLSCVANSRSEAQTLADWVVAQILASPARTTLSGVLVHQLRIEEEGDQAEFTGDGSDEPIRTTSLDVVGVYEPV